MKRTWSWSAALVVVVAVGAGVRADVKPHALFTDNMVLQHGIKAPVWGTADDGEEVTVRIQDREVKTTAKDGKWSVALDDLKAGGPYELTIAGKNRVTLKNVLVGEVWVCSGQSNMEWPVQASADPDKVKAGSANPKIRLFTVQRNNAAEPTTDIKTTGWQECGPQTVPGFSAVGYHFGKHLQKALDVPVGLIHTSWGGTPAEAWTSPKALAADPHLAGMAKTGGRLYNGMIYPLQPFAIKGAIWYQGESNAGRAYQYRTLFPTMIKDWRATWGQGDFPFLFVQLAPFMDIKKEPMESAWAELREAQLLTTKIVKNTGMAVITDVGAEKDIHPKQKEPVGQRLAVAAEAIAYGKKVVYSGPIYESLKVDGNKAVLRFQHVGGGLEARGGPLTGFTVCGDDKVFVNAEAEIRDDTVVVWSDKVAKPVAVRFGWANFPVVNLWNKDGLPASPFRTDNFPLTTAPKEPVKVGAR